MSDQAPNYDFGEGSRGGQWQPAPGFTYAGDAWCFLCSSYAPAERALANATHVRFGEHAGPSGRCQGVGAQVIQQRPAKDEF